MTPREIDAQVADMPRRVLARLRSDTHVCQQDIAIDCTWSDGYAALDILNRLRDAGYAAFCSAAPHLWTLTDKGRSLFAALEGVEV